MHTLSSRHPGLHVGLMCSRKRGRGGRRGRKDLDEENRANVIKQSVPRGAPESLPQCREWLPQSEATEIKYPDSYVWHLIWQVLPTVVKVPCPTVERHENP